MVFLKHLRYTKSFFWAKYLTSQFIPIQDYSYDRNTDKLFIRSVSRTFGRNEYQLFFKCYKKYNSLFHRNNIKFIFENNQIFVNIEDLTIMIETEEDFYIINEIFIDNTYNITSIENSILIDVGMNIGITSLYFARKEFIKRIYSFEPVFETYSAALNNINRNSFVSTKINPFNFGLGSENQTVKVSFNPMAKGKTSLFNSYSSNLNVIENIQIKKVSEIFETIFFDNNEDYDIILKLDCEGSEYSILVDLEKVNFLERIKVIIIEWHKIEKLQFGASYINKILTRNQFVVLQNSSIENEIGTIYAFRS